VREEELWKNHNAGTIYSFTLRNEQVVDMILDIYILIYTVYIYIYCLYKFIFIIIIYLLLLLLL
jgi:hypothetical protein